MASVDYRLSGEAQWPAQLHDAKAAVRWLRARADETGIDATRIAAWGESAGGHLAALLGLTGPDLDGEIGITGPSSAVLAVAAWYAPSDLATIAREIGDDPMADDSREAQLVGAPLATVPDRVTQASPLSHVRAGAPPFLLLHGRTTTSSPARKVSVCARRWHRRATRSSSRPTPGPTICGEAHRLRLPTR